MEDIKDPVNVEEQDAGSDGLPNKDILEASKHYDETLYSEAIVNGDDPDLYLFLEIMPFLDEADRVMSKYEADRDWVVMATALWEIYRHRFGLGKQAKTAADASGASRYFNIYFDRSFSHLETCPQEQASRWLQDVLVRVESNLAMEKAVSLGESDKLFMWELFADKIISKIELLESGCISMHEGELSSDTFPAGFDHSRQNISARGFIRRNLSVPETGTKEAYIREIYRRWLTEWKAELTSTNGEEWMRSNGNKLLAYNAFRSYFYEIQQTSFRT